MHPQSFSIGDVLLVPAVDSGLPSDGRPRLQSLLPRQLSPRSPRQLALETWSDAREGGPCPPRASVLAGGNHQRDASFSFPLDRSLIAQIMESFSKQGNLSFRGRPQEGTILPGPGQASSAAPQRHQVQASPAGKEGADPPCGNSLGLLLGICPWTCH